MSGKTESRLRRLLPALVCLFLAGTAGAAEWNTTTLLERLALQKSGRASFVEKKYLAILDKPVESSGTLSFDAPDRLEKRTLKPRAELLRLEGGTLTIEQAGKAPLTISLAARPEATAFVDSIRATLAGDRKALEESWRVTLDGSPASWRLILLPRYSRIADLVSRIVIGGREADVQRIDFELADGDRSEMRITRTAP